jgi:hypothetical protein
LRPDQHYLLTTLSAEVKEAFCGGTMLNNAHQVILDEDGLKNLLAVTPKQPLELRLAALGVQESTEWQDKLESLRRECGCSMGTVFTILGLAAYLVFLLLGGARTLHHVWTAVLAGFGVVFVSAGMGKAIGISRARNKLQKAVEQLLLVVEQKKEAQYAVCTVERQSHEDVLRIQR